MGFGRKLKTITATELRTRFKPRSRIGHGLVSAAPWIDIVFLFFIFLMIDGRFVLQAGYNVDLPEAPFTEGIRPGAMMVITSTRSGLKGERNEMIFFDDVCFNPLKREHMLKLRDSLEQTAAADGDAGLVVFADSMVRHGTLMEILRMAQEAGIATVNMASRRPGRHKSVADSVEQQ